MQQFSNIKNHLDVQGRVRTWPSKQSLKAEILEYLAGFFEAGVYYTEKEVNTLLNDRHTFNDAALLRRELYEHQYLDRERNCSRYWKKGPALISKRAETSRLLISDATSEECERLQEVYETGDYLKDWVGEACKPGYIQRQLTEGDVPPGGRKEYFRLKSIYRKESMELVGLLEIYHGYPDERTLWIGYLFFRPKDQQKGYGSEIIGFMTEEAKSNKYEKLGIGVHLKNWPAIRFWTKQGFDRITRIKGDKIHSENTFCVMALEKNLV